MSFADVAIDEVPPTVEDQEIMQVKTDFIYRGAGGSDSEKSAGGMLQYTEIPL